MHGVFGSNGSFFTCNIGPFCGRKRSSKMGENYFMVRTHTHTLAYNRQ